MIHARLPVYPDAAARDARIAELLEASRKSGERVMDIIENELPAIREGFPAWVREGK